MILSASRRTDIPCYYADWFLRRLQEGFVLVRNPMNHKQLFRIALSPQEIDCIVFWSKDPTNLLPYLGELDRLGYHYYVQFTLTPYDHLLEPNLRPKADIERTFHELSACVGREGVVWRYDPIILNDILTVSYHKEQFQHFCEKLAPFTDTVTISFVDLYAKVKTPLIRAILPEEMADLSSFIGNTSKAYGLRATGCCEAMDLSLFGIEKASCVDPARIEKLLGHPLALPPDKNQRPGCGCCTSVDIGAYNTCLNGCVYCYANNSPAAVRRCVEEHDPASPLLTGTVASGEIIKNRSI